MSFLNVNNVKHLIIAKDVARTANASIDPTSADYIADGEIIVTNPGGKYLNAVGVVGEEEIVIRQGRGGELEVISPIIRRTGGSKLTLGHVAQLEEIWTIGFDGSAGAFDVINDNLYMLNVDMKESSVFGFGQQKHKYGVFKSDASAAQHEIVNGLVVSLIANFSREPEKDVVFDMLCSVASAAVGAITADLVQDSDQVLFSGAHTLLVGDYIRIGGATTDVVYKVKSVPAIDEVILTTVYQGTSVNGFAFQAILSAAAVVGDFGIKATGQEREFKAGIFHYSKVRFELIPSDFGTTPVNRAQGAVEGSGNWEQIAELEWITQGNEGNYYRSRSGAPADTARVTVDKTIDYVTISIKYEKSTHASIGAKDVSPGEVVVAIPTGAAGTSITHATDGIVAILDAFYA